MPCAPGPWYLDDTFVFTVNMHLVTGAESDADAAPTYRVYEMTTDTPILTGTMAKLDDANTVGLYAATLTLSAANGFEVGKSYTVREHATIPEWRRLGIGSNADPPAFHVGRELRLPLRHLKLQAGRVLRIEAGHDLRSRSPRLCFQRP